MPVDRLEMNRLQGQQALLQRILAHFHVDEIEEVFNPPYETSIRALDVLCNTPWSANLSPLTIPGELLIL